MTSQERNHLRALIDQARRARITNPNGCAGCGTTLDNYVPGCATCTNRRLKRQARTVNPPARKGRCRGCGQPYYEHTKNCETCRERHRWRTRSRSRV